MRQFLDEVHDVCPYAGKMSREGKIQWEGLPKGAAHDPRPLRGEVYKKLQQFLKDRGGKRNLIFVFDEDLPDADQAHMAAKRLLTELDILGTYLANPGVDIRELERFVGEHRIQELLNPKKHVETPSFRWRNGDPEQDKEGTIFAFMMHPIYTKTHARYAPHPCVVLTFMSDIDHVFLEETAVAARIGVNAAIGIIADAVPDFSVTELRAGSSMEIVKDEDGKLLGFSPNFHPAVTLRLQLLAAMFGGKKLFVYPMPKEVLKA